MDRIATAAVLELSDITVRFGGVTALGGVTLQFHAGELCGLIGPNGAGKTTLFDTISGFVDPTSGTVAMDGRDVTDRSPTWRSRRGLRRTFQRQQTFGWLSVEDNLLVASEWHGGGGGMVADLFGTPTRRAHERARRTRAIEVLDLCGLGDVRSASAGRLPIGKLRMLEMARAIVDQPKVLLLDEPTSGLGEAETALLADVVDTVRNEEGCTVLLVEHDIRFIMDRCDRVVALHLGELLADGTPEQVQADDAVSVAYLG